MLKIYNKEKRTRIIAAQSESRPPSLHTIQTDNGTQRAASGEQNPIRFQTILRAAQRSGRLLQLLGCAVINYLNHLCDGRVWVLVWICVLWCTFQYYIRTQFNIQSIRYIWMHSYTNVCAQFIQCVYNSNVYSKTYALYCNIGTLNWRWFYSLSNKIVQIKLFRNVLSTQIIIRPHNMSSFSRILFHFLFCCMFSVCGNSKLL